MVSWASWAPWEFHLPSLAEYPTRYYPFEKDRKRAWKCLPCPEGQDCSSQQGSKEDGIEKGFVDTCKMKTLNLFLKQVPAINVFSF